MNMKSHSSQFPILEMYFQRNALPTPEKVQAVLFMFYSCSCINKFTFRSLGSTGLVRFAIRELNSRCMSIFRWRHPHLHEIAWWLAGTLREFEYPPPLRKGPSVGNQGQPYMLGTMYLVLEISVSPICLALMYLVARPSIADQ